MLLWQLSALCENIQMVECVFSCWAIKEEFHVLYSLCSQVVGMSKCVKGLKKFWWTGSSDVSQCQLGLKTRPSNHKVITIVVKVPANNRLCTILAFVPNLHVLYKHERLQMFITWHSHLEVKGDVGGRGGQEATKRSTLFGSAFQNKCETTRYFWRGTAAF